MDNQRLYSDEEAEQILRRAAGGQTGGVSEDRLLQMGEELGISRDAVLAATAQVRDEASLAADRREFARAKRQGALSNFLGFLVLVGGLGIVNFKNNGTLTWIWWVAVPWGFGTVMQTIAAFSLGSSDNQKEFDKWRAKKRNRLSGVQVDESAPALTIKQLMPLVEAEALRENLNRIEAIKRLRDQTGVSLVEAKNAVDMFDRTNPGILRS